MERGRCAAFYDGRPSKRVPRSHDGIFLVPGTMVEFGLEFGIATVSLNQLSILREPDSSNFIAYSI